MYRTALLILLIAQVSAAMAQPADGVMELVQPGQLPFSQTKDGVRFTLISNGFPALP
jgi:hypothetical protein